MARYLFEGFCNLLYDSELTYEEVLEREEQLKEAIQTLLEDNDAVHIDFVPLSDTLQVQWALAECPQSTWEAICQGMARLNVNGVQGTLVLIERSLGTLRLCHLDAGIASPSRLDIPLPNDPKLRKGLRIVWEDARKRR